jgi:hypothetical protein
MKKNKKVNLVKFAFLFYICLLFFLNSGKVYAQNASLSFSPASTTVIVSQTVTITVMVDSGGENISGVTADFTYPSNLLEFVSIDSANSEFSVEAEADHVTGTVFLSRAVSGGNTFNGTGEVSRVTFRGLSNGTSTLTFTDDTLVTSSGEDDILGTRSTGTIIVNTTGTIPAAGIFNKPTVLVITSFAFILICIGTYGVIQYFKDRKNKLNNF